MQILASFLDSHLSSISIGLVATLLMIFGADVNRFFRKATRKVGFVVRYALFVILCSAGYGFLSSQAVHILETFLRTLPALPKISTVAGAFLLLAFFARQSREI